MAILYHQIDAVKQLFHPADGMTRRPSRFHHVSCKAARSRSDIASKSVQPHQVALLAR